MLSPWSTWCWLWSFPPLPEMIIPIPTRMDTTQYGSFINLNSFYGSHSWQYSALQWRHLQIWKAASITKCFFKWHVSCVFDNWANPMMMLPGDSRYNLALSLLKSDNCRQSYTASGPHVPMCPPLASGLRSGCTRVDVTIKYDISKISGGLFWDEWRWY